MISAQHLKLTDNYLISLANALVISMNKYYDQLQPALNRILKTLQHEQLIFNQTLERGMKLFSEAIRTKSLDDAMVFKLVDTYGFPFELIFELAKDYNVIVDENAYIKHLSSQQAAGRAHFDAKGMISQNIQLLQFTTPSEFDYINLTMKHVKIIGCFDQNFKLIPKLNTTG
jgi:alanyl-tRNA synthetase